MARRRFTTRSEDAAFIARHLADTTRDWKVGDKCASYDGRTETTIAEIVDLPAGKGVRLVNGDGMHITKVRTFNPNR